MIKHYFNKPEFNPPHGGCLDIAAQHFGIPIINWLDLSTGINPNPWPIPQYLINLNHWSRLPLEQDSLIEVAAEYYGTSQILPIAGSQAALQLLPWLRDRGQVGVPALGYHEHALAWQAAGHQVVYLPNEDPEFWLKYSFKSNTCLIIINPNNPTGYCWSVDFLRELHANLIKKKGWLIIDEAFIDPTPLASLASDASLEGLIILRSFGKFFGLAGARVGFILTTEKLRETIRARLGPWALSTPARLIAQLALTDYTWQHAMRAQLLQASQRLINLLIKYNLASAGGTALFQWIKTSQAQYIQNNLAQQGILVRLFTQPASIRFGLPGIESDWQRLEHALIELKL